MVAAAALHDVLEDTDCPESDILELVGPEVLELVKELTNISKATEAKRAERKRMDRDRLATVSKETKLIKLIDRIDNLNEMDGAPEDFQRLYAQESLLLVEAIADASPELAEELREAARRYL
jgi:(p)ppGpp synthase/HD superfamily hydrolase